MIRRERYSDIFPRLRFLINEKHVYVPQQLSHNGSTLWRWKVKRGKHTSQSICLLSSIKIGLQASVKSLQIQQLIETTFAHYTCHIYTNRKHCASEVNGPWLHDWFSTGGGKRNLISFRMPKCNETDRSCKFIYGIYGYLSQVFRDASTNSNQAQYINTNTAILLTYIVYGTRMSKILEKIWALKF